MFQRMLAATALIAASTAAQADTKIPFTLDWKFEGPAAPYFMALDKGYFADAGLEVEIASGVGSTDAIPKVATGAFPMGFGDINVLVKFLDQNPDAPIIGIMMTYNKPPFAIIGRKSLGIETPKDLEGKVLGAPPPDAAWAQFPIFAVENDLDVDKITVEPVGFPTREPMLVEGKVDAVAGYNFSSVLNTARLGVPMEDITTLMMADYGLKLYGNTIIVNTDWAKDHEVEIKAFIEAVAMGWKDSIADPAAAIAGLKKRNVAADSDLEQQRLQLTIDGNILTDEVAANGFGPIDEEKFAASLEQMKLTYEFKNEIDLDKYFTEEYLPEGGFSLK